MISETDIIKILRETDALMKGHFILSSGLHSAEYLQCSKLTMYPKKLEILCKSLTEKIENKYKNIDMIASPALGGIIVGYEVSRCLNIPNVFVEINGRAGKAMMAQNFKMRRGSLSRQTIANKVTVGSMTSVTKRHGTRNVKVWVSLK